MSIIGETPTSYDILDPSNFDNMSLHFESFDGDEILELDSIPAYIRSIQQVLVDP